MVMGLLGRSKEEKSEGEIPDEFVMLVAKKLFESYGSEIAETINKKTLQQLEPIRSRMAQMEKEIQYLKATSDEKIKDLLKSTIEVAMESVAEKSANKAVEHVGLNKVETLSDSLKILKELQMEMSEKLDNITKISKTTERTLSEVSNILENVSSLTEGVDSVLNKVVERFKTRVDDAVNRAVKQIRENVVVDKGLIESVVSQSLSKIVSTKFREIESKINGISSKVDLLNNVIKRLEGLEDAINTMSEKLSSIEDAIKETHIRLETQSMVEKFEKAKSAQDEEEYSVGE